MRKFSITDCLQIVINSGPSFWAHLIAGWHFDLLSRTARQTAEGMAFFNCGKLNTRALSWSIKLSPAQHCFVFTISTESEPFSNWNINSIYRICWLLRKRCRCILPLCYLHLTLSKLQIIDKKLQHQETWIILNAFKMCEHIYSWAVLCKLARNRKRQEDIKKQPLKSAGLFYKNNPAELQPSYLACILYSFTATIYLL